MSEVLKNADVIKAGGAALLDKNADGTVSVRQGVFGAVAEEVSQEEERNIALVSSIAIAKGMMVTGTKIRPDKEVAMPQLQRLSVRGWPHVVNDWDGAISRDTGPVLLTRQELDDEGMRDEALHLIYEMFRHGEVPLINENDAITHDEITYGSNDILSAILAARMQRSELFGDVRLFLLTDVDGVYEDINDPNTRIPVIANAEDYSYLAVDSDSVHHIGGMTSKLAAVEIAKEAGVPSYIYNPAHGPRQRAVDGEIGTHFPV